MPITVAARCKGRVDGCSLVGTAGSNPTGEVMDVRCQYCIGSGLGVGPITYPEESTECMVSECDYCEASITRKALVI